MSDLEKDSVVVRDRSSRRKFIRRGAAFVAAGGLASSTQNVFADDCDRNEGELKNAQAPGSDADSGEGADATGCGKQPKPKISQNHKSLEMETNVKVVKIKA